MSMSAPQILEPQTHRWTRAEFNQMGELGWFHDRRVELIEGEVVEMPPLGNRHCISTECTADALRNAFGPGFWVRVQMPLDLGMLSEPEPDIAVVQGLPRHYTSHPTTALLVAEISDTTLKLDQIRKASLYARAGIADYWIVNLVEQQVEIHRQPQADASQPFGFSYADLVILKPSDFVTPLAVPRARILVADLLA
jgi:Uma2 family endonuclease